MTEGAGNLIVVVSQIFSKAVHIIHRLGNRSGLLIEHRFDRGRGVDQAGRSPVQIRDDFL